MIKVCAVCGKNFSYTGMLHDYAFKSQINGRTTYFCGYNCQNIGEEMREKISIDSKVLRRARATYGDSNQIAVSIEEMSELTKVLTKYFRYDKDTAVSKLREDALDEVTDVYIILEHVKSIFGLRNGEINKRSEAKLSRLSRWMDNSSEFSYTMEDRDV